MKILCPACQKPTPRNKLVIVPGLKIRGRVARACQACVDKPDAEHKTEYEKECGEVDNARKN